MLYLLLVFTSAMNVFLVQAVDVINDPELRIVAGVDCTAEEVPYLVSIQTLKQEHWCGGTLLSEKWVLTAAHCCPKKAMGKLAVHTGLSSLRKPSVQSSRVVQQFAHPKYHGEDLKNDVCLLKLKTPIFASDNIYYTPLANRSYWDLHRMDHCASGLVLGFGYRGDMHLNGTVVTPIKTYDTKLQCANLSIVADEYCNKQHAIDNSMFCAIDFVKRKPGPCSGDSGGPLICKGIQYGVISAVVGCGIGWYPTLFARVDIHMEFFEAIIGNKCGRSGSFGSFVHAVDVINDTALGIVAGVDCTAEEVPYLVSIQTLKQYHWCGGTLLSQKWVLTAAHCCPKKARGKLTVHTGLSSLTKASVQSSRVVQQFAHPKYQGEDLQNDVCLLKLKTPIFESHNIYYTHLASRLHWALHRMDHCEHGLVLGFGYRGDVHLNGTVATPNKRFDTKLQCANLSIVADHYCNKQYAFDNSMFCAIDFVKRKPGPCSGDSGGPLICKGIQYGVISAAVGCGVGWYPTLFARVDIHMEFFEAIIANKCGRSASFSIFYFILILRLIVLNPI